MDWLYRVCLEMVNWFGGLGPCSAVVAALCYSQRVSATGLWDMGRCIVLRLFRYDLLTIARDCVKGERR